MTGELATSAPPRSRGRRLAGLGAGLLILAFLVYGVVDGWSRVRDFDWELHPGLLLASAATLFAFYATSGLAYGAIVRSLRPGTAQLPTLAVWARSLLGRYVPGNVLMVLGRVVLAHERGVPRRITLAATVYEQALALGVAAIGGVIFVAAYSDLGRGARLWLLLLIPAALVLLHPRVFGPLTGWLLKKIGREPLPRLLSVPQLSVLLAWYVGAAALLGLGVWLALAGSTGGEPGGPAFVGTAFLLAFAVAMAAFIFPSGLGVREAVFAAALTINVPGSVAVALAVGSRLFITLVELIFIGILVAVDRRA